jgi:hypothetical protein
LEISLARTFQTLAFTCFVALAASSCESRTLPLPPPEVGSVSAPNASGRVTVSGFALEGASIGVVNDSTLQGTIVTSPKANCDHTCSFEAVVDAKAGDNLRVWQFFDTAGAIEASVPAH